MNVKFKIKEDKIPLELKKGEAIVYYRAEKKTRGLMLACPKCGYASTGPHVYNVETKTLTKSIKCAKCKWHGHLKNGIFKTV